MKLSRRTLVSLALVAAGLVAAFACSSASTSDPSCDPVCATVDECGGTSCLAYCIALRTGCEEKGQQAAFAAWASCEATPGTLSCTNGFIPQRLESGVARLLPHRLRQLRQPLIPLTQAQQSRRKVHPNANAFSIEL